MEKKIIILKQYFFLYDMYVLQETRVNISQNTKTCDTKKTDMVFTDMTNTLGKKIVKILKSTQEKLN